LRKAGANPKETAAYNGKTRTFWAREDRAPHLKAARQRYESTGEG